MGKKHHETRHDLELKLWRKKLKKMSKAELISFAIDSRSKMEEFWAFLENASDASKDKEGTWYKELMAKKHKEAVTSACIHHQLALTNIEDKYGRVVMQSLYPSELPEPGF